MSIALDLLIGVPILISTLLGLRDGLVRKLVSLIMMLLALIIGQFFMHKVGTMLVERGLATPETASSRGFYSIFFSIGIIQALLYRLLTGNYKIGGLFDRIGGSIVGFCVGVLFMSTMLMMFALNGFPDREMKRESQFYDPIVNITPEILDEVASMGTDTFHSTQESNSPDQHTPRQKKQSHEAEDH